jgi:hypothetical protein
LLVHLSIADQPGPSLRFSPIRTGENAVNGPFCSACVHIGAELYEQRYTVVGEHLWGAWLLLGEGRSELRKRGSDKGKAAHSGASGSSSPVKFYTG